MRSPRLLAFALCALFALAAVGTARAQGGIWSTIPVPGTSVAGVADGDSGRVLIAGSNGAHRFDGFRLRRLPIFSATTDSLSGNAILRAHNGDIWFAHRGAVSVEVAEPVSADGADWHATVRLRERVREAILARLGEPDLAHIVAPLPGAGPD